MAKEKEAQLDAMRAWVKDYGSERLILGVKHGLEESLLDAWHSEMLKTELPGWENREELNRIEVSTIFDPTLEALKALDIAKKDGRVSRIELVDVERRINSSSKSREAMIGVFTSSGRREYPVIKFLNQE